MYQLRKTVLDKLNSFNNPYGDKHKLFNNVELVHFESICVQEVKFRDSDTTYSFGKHVLILFTIFVQFDWTTNLFMQFQPVALFESFVDALDGLATWSKAQMTLNVLEIETSVQRKLNQLFSALNQRRCREEPVLQFEDECIEEIEKCQMCRHSCYKHKRIILLISRMSWKDIARFF